MAKQSTPTRLPTPAACDLGQAWNDRRTLSLIHAHIPLGDASDALKRLTERLSKHI